MDTVLIAAFGGTTTESAELTQLTMTGDPGSARGAAMDLGCDRAASSALITRTEGAQASSHDRDFGNRGTAEHAGRQAVCLCTAARSHKAHGSAANRAWSAVLVLVSSAAGGL